jgi:Lysophospholipase L1 and related esterases
MKKTILAIAMAVLAITACKNQPQTPVTPIDESLRPTWFTNENYFNEKNGMYVEIPEDTAAGVIYMVGDDYIDRGAWSEFYGDNKIKNRGITYDATDHVLYRIGQIAAAKPAKIFVSAGYNDVKHGTKADDIISNVKAIFAKAAEFSPESELYYINIAINKTLDEAQAAVATAVNEGLKDVEGFTYVDINSALFDGTANGLYSWDDGKYLNGAGYEALAKCLEPYIGKTALNKAKEPKKAAQHADYYNHRASMFRSLPQTENAILMLGNSLNNNACWTELFPFTNIVNRGISGDTVEGIYDRLDEVIEDNPHKIFLLTGTNDLLDNPDITPSQLWAKYEKLIKAIRKEMPKTKLYVQSILPLNPMSKFYPGVNEKVVQVNKFIEAAQNTYEYFYIDIASKLSDEEGNLKVDYTTDGIHLSADGYFVWATELAQGPRLMFMPDPE